MKYFIPLRFQVAIPFIFMLSALIAQDDANWQIDRLGDLTFNGTNVFIDKPTISSSTFSSDSKSTLELSPYDRMLFIVEGSSIVKISAKNLEVETGDVIFLRANDDIQFSSKIKVLIWASKSTKTNHNKNSEVYTKEQIESERDSSENIWNSFIETSTMVAGLYMLPRSLDGDNTLIHEFDEINYVVNGTAKFKMDNTIINVEPGSIMWVKRGVGHNFYDLSDDFDVFILFETINMNHDH